MSSLLALFPSDLDALERTGRLDGLSELYLFAGFDRVFCVLLNERHGELRTRVLNDDFTCLEVGLRRSRFGRWARIPELFISCLDIFWRARRFRPDAVMAFDPHLLGIVGWALAHMLGCRFAIRLICHYGLKYENTGQIAFAPFGTRSREVKVERWLYRRAKGILVACPNHRDYVRSIAGNDVKLLPYLTAQSSIFYREPSRAPAVRENLGGGAKKLVVAVSRLHSEKYPEDLIACGSKLGGDPGLRLLVVGDGPLRRSLEEQARSLAAPVIFTGVLPHGTVRELLCEADAVVVLQGGGAIIEAALCRAPIATYDFEMNPFVIRPGLDEGRIVPFRDVEALAEVVRWLVDHPDEARRLGRRARAAALNRFSEESARLAERLAAKAIARDGAEEGDFGVWQVQLGSDLDDREPSASGANPG